MTRRYYTNLGLGLFFLGVLHTTVLATVSDVSLQGEKMSHTYKVFFDKLSQAEQKQVLDTYRANKPKKWLCVLLVPFGGQGVYVKSHRLLGIVTLISLVISIVAWVQAPMEFKMQGQTMLPTTTDVYLLVFGCLTICSWLGAWYKLCFGNSIKDEQTSVFRQAVEQTKTYKQSLAQALKKAKDTDLKHVPDACLPYLLTLDENRWQEAVGLFNIHKKPVRECVIKTRYFSFYTLHTPILYKLLAAPMMLFAMFWPAYLYFGLYKGGLGTGATLVYKAEIYKVLLGLHWGSFVLYKISLEFIVPTTVKQDNERIFIEQLDKVQLAHSRTVA